MVNQSKDIIQVQGINSQGYGIIPKMVMQDKRLTIQAKAIYGYFCSYVGAGKTAFPRQSKILADLKISRNCYYTHFNLLKECGYIQTYQEKNEDGSFSRNVYTLVEVLPCTKFEYTEIILPCTVQRDTIRWDINNNSINQERFQVLVPGRFFLGTFFTIPLKICFGILIYMNQRHIASQNAISDIKL